MKLSKVAIQNYRSIANMTVTFPFGCQALIGLNESGKSNILRALSLLDPTASATPADLRIERRGEDEVKGGEVGFIFELDQAEIEENCAALLERVEPGSRNEPFVNVGKGEPLTMEAFCATRTLGVHDIKIPDGKRVSTFYAIPASYTALPGWAYNPSEQAVAVSFGGSEIAVPAKGWAKLPITQIPSPLEAATPNSVNTFVGLRIKALIQANLPKCIFWKYSDQYLLPSVLDVNAFIANPDTCIPLRSMFELAGYKGAAIAESLKKAKASAPHRYIQLLRNVQDAATRHVREVWQAHKQIQIELQPNGDSLHPIISDETVPLDMANRSDGFKRFVSFLLQISAKVRSSELKNVLLLIDEPEIALNPSGARSLMQELIRVAETNTVVYSTHSIFMVDSREVARHIIVEKKNEVTSGRRADKSRIQDDQVLYAAIGYSIFEVLKEKNIIFEGWKDKEIFRIAAESVCKTNKHAKTVLSSIGLTYAEGVKDVKHVSSFLELAGRACLIISDADNAAMEKRKQYNKLGAWGTWVTLRDILGAESNALTAEDLITPAAVVKRANRWRINIPTLTALATGSLAGKPVLSALSMWLDTAALSRDEKDDALEALKNSLFADLKRDEIAEDASRLVEFVVDHDFSA